MTVTAHHILLVERDRGQAVSLQRMLADAGFRVSIVADDAAAMDLLHSDNVAARGGIDGIQAVVTSLDIDGGGGARLLAQIRVEPQLRHLPALVIARDTDESGILACIALGAVDFLIHPVRQVLLLARLRASLERKRMGDRERDYLRMVELERRRAEMLLYDVLPAEIAARMKHGEQLIADTHKEVTVIFADLVGFTSYADGRAPAEVVRMLDTLFSRFDDLAASFSIEKIKTIGDGYMAAAGLPTATADHAEAAADFALAMREVVRDTIAEDGTRFSMRIGMASGPVIAGVIGQRRHVYDLWGDTVNLASRMESTALGDAIQVTAHTAGLLSRHFNLEERGLIDIKGKSAQLTSTVIGRKRTRRGAKRATFARTARFEVRKALESAERAMHEMHLVDPISGLLSPRGFLPMAESQWRAAAREGRTLLVLVAHTVVDEVSDQETKLIARLLRSTFRDTDLLVRWRPGAFAMVGMERSPTPPAILVERVRERAASFVGDRPPPLNFSVCRLKPAAGENEHRLLEMLNEPSPRPKRS